MYSAALPPGPTAAGTNLLLGALKTNGENLAASK